MYGGSYLNAGWFFVFVSQCWLCGLWIVSINKCLLKTWRNEWIKFFKLLAGGFNCIGNRNIVKAMNSQSSHLHKERIQIPFCIEHVPWPEASQHFYCPRGHHICALFLLHGFGVTNGSCWCPTITSHATVYMCKSFSSIPRILRVDQF